MTVIACLQLPQEKDSSNVSVGGIDGSTNLSGNDGGLGSDKAARGGEAVLEAVLDVCAQLTPVVEPDGEHIWMDWTGCGPVPQLIEKLSLELARLDVPQLGVPQIDIPQPDLSRPGGASAHSGDSRARHRLGIAPLRFVAGAIAAGTVALKSRDAKFAVDTPTVCGFRITDDVLPKLLTALPIRALPELDADIRETLQALDVRTLGELSRIPKELLYSHIGRVADKLLDWAQGRDDRRVRALYPPERLERRLTAEMLGLNDGWSDHLTGSADALRMQTSVFEAAAQLAKELESSGRACAALTVAVGHQRLERTFTSPIAAPDQLGRVIWQMVQRLLGGSSGSSQRNRAAHGDDCVISVTPTRHAGQQTTLFAPDRPDSSKGATKDGQKRNVLEHPALATVRARFGHLFRFVADEDAAKRGASQISHVKESVARYEAMCRFYG